ncbi:hypothetical protein JX266_010242 [Neoarthrinium moseri]|nr:hypothetical protein JX266_010242 [Neoarthrinium moseri]
MSAPCSDATAGKTTRVQTETELSLLYRILRSVIKPLRPRLVKPGKPQPPGSTRLLSYPREKNGITIRERRHGSSGVWLYDFETVSSPNIKIKTPSTIYYFAGGAFQSPPSSQHWSFISKLANNLVLEHHFTLVSYPLAPNSPASESLPTLRKLLRSLLTDASKKGDKVILMGDSSGGNVALSLGFWWAGEIARSGNYKLRSTLESLIVISPAVDLRNCNPSISEIDSRDPLLGLKYTSAVAEAWAAAPPTDSSRTSSTEDPHLSPLLHSASSFQQLAELGIAIHGLYGTSDVLAPDAELFRCKCEEHGVKGKWLVWVDQMHCFVLAGVYGMKEGRTGIEWITKLLKEVIATEP